MSFVSIRTTFEEYNNAVETRKWHVKFLKEHNQISLSAAHQLSTRTITTWASSTKWVRIRRDGEVVGHARLTQPYIGLSHWCVSDIYIDKKYRGKGLFHIIMPDLLTWSGAEAVTLVQDKCDKYCEFYDSLGLTFIMAAEEHPNLVRVMTPNVCADITIEAMKSGNATTDTMSDRLKILVNKRLAEVA